MSRTQEKYEIESIVRAAVFWRKRGVIHWKYLVKWKGYSHEENTWEPADSFDTPETVNEFWRNTDTNGRDIRNGRLFKMGEEFFPRSMSNNITEPKSDKSTPKSVRFERNVYLNEDDKSEELRRSNRKVSQSTETPKAIDPNSSKSNRKRTRETSAKDTTTETNKRRRSSPPRRSQHITPQTRSTSVEASAELTSLYPNKSKHVEVVIVRDAAAQPTQATGVTLDNTTNEVVVPQGDDVPMDPGSPHDSLFSGSDDDKNDEPPENAPGSRGRNDSIPNIVEKPVPTPSVPEPRRISAPFIPAHRARKPLVKMVEEPLIQLGPGRAIPIKAKLIAKLQSGSALAASSEQVNNTTKDLDLANHVSGTTQANGGPNTQNGHTSSSDSSGSSVLHMSDLVHESLLGPPEQDMTQGDISLTEPFILDPIPTGLELLNLAGYDSDIQDELPDFAQDTNESLDPGIHQDPEMWKMAGPSSLIQPYVGMATNGQSDLFLNAVSTETNTQPWFMTHGLVSNAEDLSRYSILLTLNPSTTIPVKFRDISSSNFGSAFQLDNLLPPSCTGPPGKLYNIGVLRHLKTGGSSARLSEDDIVSNTDKELFQLLKRTLDGGKLLIGVFCSYVLVFCSSQNEATCEKLGIPESLVSHLSAILVSHVMIDDDSGFADYAMQAEDLELRSSS